ncbi:hypothetical protein CAEBREN_20652 [Caenorhabditis brenneri]|uniref:Tyrosine-protein phosphatase domain-containing protein n=1 Tax=Caenorhabditis brenneri TaxID=135651 RepID=G0N669_CAEBE|nr:hypothetical protein CAEBREN_20652 [Caenorhabditis brenneri]
MGSLTVEDVTNLKPDSIEKVLNALGQNSKTTPDKGVGELEKRLISLEKIRDISKKLENLKEIPGQKEYATSLASVGKLPGHKTSLSTSKDEVVTMNNALNTLKTLTEQKNDAAAIRNFVTVFQRLTVLESLAGSFDDIKNDVDEARKILKHSDFIGVLVAENQFRDLAKADYDKNLPTVLKNFDEVGANSQEAINSQEDFKIVQKLLQTRGPFHRQTFQYTAGLPRGPDNLRDIETSIEDSSIAGRISNWDTVKASLKTVFEPFKDLHKQIEAVATEWKDLKTNYNKINDVINIVINLGSLPDVSQLASDVANKMKDCELADYPKSNLQAIVKLENSMQELNSKIKKLGDFKYMSEFSNLSSLKAYFDTEGKSDKDKAALATSTLKAWNTDENLKTFVANVAKLQNDLTNLMDITADLPKSIDLNVVTTHQNSIDTPEYKTFLTCMRDIEADGFPVRDLIDHIRNPKQMSISAEAKNAITKVVNSGDALKNAESAAEKFKSLSTLRPKLDVIKASFEQVDYSDVARKLGMGVQGLDAIRKAETASLGDLLGKTDKIISAARDDGLRQDYQDSLKQLKDVKQTLVSIESFLKTSKSLQAIRRKRNTGFQSFGSIFEDAANAQGSKIDMKTLRDAMDALNSATPQKPDTMQALSTLESLDLDFSKFEIGGAASSLSAMDSFFGKYVDYLTGSAKLPSPGQSSATTQSGQKNSVEATTTGTGNGAIEWLAKNWWIILIGVLGVALIAVIVWLVKQKPWNKTPKDNKNSGNIEHGTVTTPTESPATPAQQPQAPIAAEQPPEAPIQQPPAQNANANQEDGAPQIVFPNTRYIPKGEMDPPGNNAPLGGAPPNPPPLPARLEGDQNAPPPPPEDQNGQAHPDADQNAQAPPDDNQNAQHHPEADQNAQLPPNNEGAPIAPVVPPVKLCLKDSLFLLYQMSSELKRRLKAKTSLLAYLEELLEGLNGEEIANERDNPTDNINQKRKPMSCTLHTMVKAEGFKNNFISCNYHDFPTRRCYLAQHPLNGKEREKIDTREKYLSVIYNKKIKGIACLSHYKEKLPLFHPEEPTDPSKLKPFQIGKYALQTKDPLVKRVIKKEEVYKFDLTMKDTEKKTDVARKFSVLEYDHWDANVPPKYPEIAMELIRFLKLREGSVMIQCSDGVGRSGTLASIMLGIEECKKRKVENVADIIKPIRESRFGAVNEPLQIMYIVLTIAAQIIKDMNAASPPEYWELKYFYEKLRNPSYYNKLLADEKKKQQFVDKEIKKMIEYRRKQAEDERKRKATKQQHPKKISTSKNSKNQERKSVAQEKDGPQKKLDEKKPEEKEIEEDPTQKSEEMEKPTSSGAVKDVKEPSKDKSQKTNLTKSNTTGSKNKSRRSVKSGTKSAKSNRKSETKK